MSKLSMIINERIEKFDESITDLEIDCYMSELPPLPKKLKSLKITIYSKLESSIDLPEELENLTLINKLKNTIYYIRDLPLKLKTLTCANCRYRGILPENLEELILNETNEFYLKELFSSIKKVNIKKLHINRIKFIEDFSNFNKILLSLPNLEELVTKSSEINNVKLSSNVRLILLD